MPLHLNFIRTAQRFGSKTAFIDCSSGRELSYFKTLTAALILAGKFNAYERGFIGVMIPTSAGCGIAVIGALLSGRTPVMINYSTGAERNALYAQKKCDFTTIITSKALLEKIGCPFVEGMVFIEDLFAGVSFQEKIKAGLKAKLPLSILSRLVHRGNEDDTCVILFTSGSEKEPKAVQLTHRNITSNIEAFTKVTGVADKDRMLANLPLFHVFGLTVNFWAPMYHGMTVVSFANPLEYRTICSIIKEKKPTLMVGTPSFLAGYLRKSEPGEFESLRLVLTGADKCPDSVMREFTDMHGITLYEGYGATETSPVISVNNPNNFRPGSVGKPLPGVEVRIENYETGEDCPPGVTGRVLVKGELVMKGYLDDFEETSMRVRHGWYDTGDMGYLDEDGYLWHAGRLKRFVKIGGEMVSLVKVERELEAVLPEGVACCIVETPDAVKGAKIIAAVTHHVDEKKMLKLMSSNLPQIALPKQFVVIEEFPKMASGKIDFRKVTELVSENLHKVR